MLRFQYRTYISSGITKWGFFSAKSGYFYYAIHTLPDFLVTELNEYVSKLYGIMENDRLFMITKTYLEKEMNRGVKLSGVKRIRLHDLRHSHASLLISKLGAQPHLVAERLGHEKVQTTLSTYSHLYPNQSRDLADQINRLMDEADEEGSDNDA